MDFIFENYIIIIFVGLFFIFALIGYLVDMFRNNKKEEIEEPIKVNTVSIEDIKVLKNKSIENKEDNSESIVLDQNDELLKKYEDEMDEK